MAGTRLKKNDIVKIIAGKDKGSTGKVIAVNVAKGKVIVEGHNMMKKTVKKKSQQEQGGIIAVEAPLDISNVQLFVKGKSTRVTYKFEADKKKTRVAKKTGDIL